MEAALCHRRHFLAGDNVKNGTRLIPSTTATWSDLNRRTRERTPEMTVRRHHRRHLLASLLDHLHHRAPNTMSFQRKQEKDFTPEVKELTPEVEKLASVSYVRLYD